jgi:tetratricopeptide (TPR) repeat protein
MIPATHHAGQPDHDRTVDQDAVLRARTTLLGSGRLGPRQEADACRVLAEVSPRAYLPRLVRALLNLSYELGDHPRTRLDVCAEAADAARRLATSAPGRAELLNDALNAYQRLLYVNGRRAEGFFVREEMARAGQQAFEAGHVASPVFGSGPLATALAEEGRHREAAELCGRIVAAARQGDSGEDASFWDMVEWAAELDAAGCHEAALDVFGELVASTRRRQAEGRTSSANLLWELVRYADMLDSSGKADGARAARREAGELLTELAASGENTSWSCILAWWRILLGLSGRVHEQPRPGEPVLPFGSDTLAWSPGLWAAYVDGRAGLEAAAASLAPLARTDPGNHLAQLVTVHRRLTIRSAFFWERRTHRILEPLLPLFDEGVRLARRLADVDEDAGRDVLARALTDRSTLLVAGKRYGAALDDFREATQVRG